MAGSVASRVSLVGTNHLAPTGDELDRARRHEARPALRWHYRCTASSLAWEAARLMPDNSDETARVLCEGGSWIKYLDPPAADVLYKALVRRCRKTAIGTEADRIRGFPRLDETGNLRPRQPLSRAERAAQIPSTTGPTNEAPALER